MNDLSWMLYAADVAGDLDWLFSLMAGAGMFGAGVWALAAFFAGDEFGAAGWKKWLKVGYGLILPLFLGGSILAGLVPAKETVYAIAASEMGERVVNTPTAAKAVKALDAWLDRQIAGEEPAHN